MLLMLPLLGWGQVSLTGTPVVQSFNTLTSGTWSDNTTLQGWYARTDATASIATYGTNTGITTAAGLYAFGVAGTNAVTEKALGYAPTNAFTGGSGAGKGYLGLRLQNNTGSSITSFTVTYTGEQWRRDNAANQSISFDYQTGASVTSVVSGTFTSEPALTFTSPVLGSTASLLDGNAAANRTAGITATITLSTALPNGSEIMLRWVDLNDSGNDHFLAIDDVTVSYVTGTPPTVVLPTVTSAAVSAITATTATAGGEVTADGNGNVTRGVAYGTATAPTTAGSTVAASGTGTGTFSVSLTGLTASTTYYVRAYATNGAGTAYGPEVSFTTAAPTPNPVPTISTLSPSTAVAGGGSFALTVEGNNFVAGSTATFNGTARAVTFVSATEITVAVLAADIATAGSYNVAVTNPAPGGGTTSQTAASTFTVTSSPATSTLLLYSFDTRVVAPDAPPASSASVTGSSVAIGSGLGRTTATNAYVISGLDNSSATTRRATEFYQFSITAVAGSQLSLASIGYTDLVTLATGPNTAEVTYSLTSTFASQISLGTLPVTTTATIRNISLSGTAALQNVAAGTVLYFRIYPFGGSNGSATYSLDNLRLSGSVAPVPSFAYYAKATGDLNDLATFGTNSDGSGTAPTSFTTNNSTYNITGTNRRITANWAVSGTNSTAILTSGSSFTIPAAFNYTGPLDLSGTAYLTVLNPAPAVVLGSVSASSTVEYAQAGTYTVPAILNGYGNLILRNGTKLIADGNVRDTEVFGNLTIDNVTNLGGANTAVYSNIVLLGDLTLQGTTTFNLASASRIGLTLLGVSTQTLAGNGNTIRLYKLDVQNNAVLSDANGGTPLELGNNSGNGGGYNLTSNKTLALNSNTLSFMPGGNATITGTGTLTVTPASSLDLESGNNSFFFGDLYLTPGNTTLNNLRVIPVAGDYLGVTQSLTVNGTLTLGVGGLQIGANQTLTLNGPVVNTTGLLIGSATSNLVIGGTGALGTILFPTGTNTTATNQRRLNNLTINRAGATLAVGSPVTVGGTLALTDGLLSSSTSGSGSTLILATTATISGGSPTSYVNGPLTRIIGAGAATTVFPIGKGTAYRPLTLNATAQASTTTYTGEILNSTARTTAVDAPLNRVSNLRYATLTPTVQPSGFSGTITLSFGADDYVTDPQASTLVVAKRNGSGTWTNIDRTTATGNAIGGNVSGSITSGVFTSFSDFALASTDAGTNNLLGSNPLPVELTAFAAERRSDQFVSVTWATASEKQADRFEVQRSADSRAFETIATATAQGSSSQATRYAALDKTAPAGPLYYRLRQVDLDGTVAYSPVVRVGGAAALELAVYPNPATERLTATAAAQAGRRYRVLNAVGQVLATGAAEQANPSVEVRSLPAGSYLLELLGPGGRQVRRFVKGN
jgi:hypothetical protein